MQYKVPQNVDIEDRVIAGLTLRQFMFLMIAGGFVLILRYVFTGPISFLFLPVALIIGGFGVALAFVKINDRPFEIFLVSAAKTLITPKQRVWSKDLEIEPPHPETAKKIEEVQKKQALGDIKSNLERLATIVDSGGAHETNISDSHVTNVKPKDVEDVSHLQDVLEQADQKPAELTKIIEQAKEYVGKNKKEETVGSMATVQAKATDFKYEKIGLKDEKELEEILDKATQKQKELDSKLETATIRKFDRNE